VKGSQVIAENFAQDQNNSTHRIRSYPYLLCVQGKPSAIFASEECCQFHFSTQCVLCVVQVIATRPTATSG